MSSAAVAIVVARDPMPWSPADADGQGLGGSELAVVRVAAGLARRGRAVTVYANLREGEAVHSGARYRARDAFAADEPRTAVIACRAFELLDEPPAATTLLWVHTPHAGSALTAPRARALDRLLALSAWHAERLRAAHPFAAGKIAVIRNGVDPLPLSDHRAARVLSTSQPERGLDVLLELWPQVRAEVPGAELAAVWAPVYDHVESRNEQVAAHRRRVRALAEQPGVRLLGPVPRPRLLELMAGSRVWAHPSWSTAAGLPFEEISCISAMEAQAAGLWAVASAVGALPETVRVGALVDAAEAPGPAWRERLAAEIVRGLADPATGARARREGPVAMRDLGWDGVAAAMDGLIGEPGGGVTRVSVIVPAYNEERWLGAALAALAGQTHRDYEVIVVDDGSTDATAEIAEGFEVTLLRTGHRGDCLARNAGAAVATGEILMFVDADEIVAPDFVERLAAPLADPAVGATFPGGIRWHNLEAPWARGWLHIRRGGPRFTDPLVRDTNRIVRALRRSRFEEVGGYPPAGYGGDEVFSARVGEALVAHDARLRYTLPEGAAEIFGKARWIGRGPLFARDRPPLWELLPPYSWISALRLALTGHRHAALTRIVYDAGLLLGFLESRVRPRVRNIA